MKQTIQPVPPEDLVKPKVGEAKKKISLANINSKLNNMLSAKKISISTALVADPEKEEKDEKTKKMDPDYDPQCPNSYEISKGQFLAFL